MSSRTSTLGTQPRAWRTPPAIEFEPGEILPGAFILGELSGPAALLFWQTLRDVTLWARVPTEHREGLFAPGATRARTWLARSAQLDTGIGLLFENLLATLAHPERADHGVIADLCLRIAREAEMRGLLHSAVAYAQAAASVDPADPIPCIEVGRAALALAHVGRAESWLYRAIGIARRAADPVSSARAWSEFALVAEKSNRLAAASARYLTAFRAARRIREPHLRVRARYGIMRVATSLNDFATAERQVRYVLRHPWDPNTAASVRLDAVELFLRFGDLRRAASHLAGLSENSLPQDHQFLAIAYRAYIAAASGKTSQVAEAWHDLMPDLGSAKPSEHAARAAAELSRAMAVIGDRKRLAEATELAQRFQRESPFRSWFTGERTNPGGLDESG